jgi:tryptophan 2,3-dioxygenase
VETTLGLSMDTRHQNEYYKRTGEGGFNQGDYTKINESESKESLIHLVNNWLERMPFFDNDLWENFSLPTDDLHPFWSQYRKIYEDGLTEKEAENIQGFDMVFFEKKNAEVNEAAQPNNSALSPKAMRSALFIMLYRDFPVFQTSYQILDSLIEIDHQMAGWRHKHLVMVRRMIGMRTGTGGSSGAGYLEGALTKHNIFGDIEGLSTFLIERKKLPKLPEQLIKKLSYSF